MAYKYRVTYKETIKTLETVCELFDIDNSDITIKFVIGAAGIVVLVMMFIYGEPGGGTMPGLALFFLKYLAAWAALGITALIINRTAWRKAVQATAAGDAEEMYKLRKTKEGTNITGQIDFYEEHFESVTKVKTRAFEYAQVVKLLETERGFGLVVKKDKDVRGSVRVMIGFPKEALLEGDIEELKKFLLERCPGVKSKIKKL